MQVVRNENGLWVNSQVFSEAAQHFSRYGRYTDLVWDSSEGVEFWNTEMDRCLNGLEVCGARITGDHYFYLNYSPIKRLHSGEKTKRKGFPAFYDGDYDYYWNVEISDVGCSEKFMKSLRLMNEPKFLDGGRRFILAKARRKGFSYKNAAMAVNKYNNTAGAKIILTAYDSKYLYPSGTFTMCTRVMDHLNEHTAFIKLREFVDTVKHKRASYKEIDPITKRVYEKGYMSEIQAITCQDNPDALRGIDADLVLVEEGGDFLNLKDMLGIMMPSTEAGMYRTGRVIIWGTGGNILDSSADFADIFYSSETEGYNAYVNRWEANATSTCGYYFPDMLCLDGFIDENGNSDQKGAYQYEQKQQEILAKAGKKAQLDRRKVEHANTPGESFLAVGMNPFPLIEIQNHYANVIKNKLFESSCYPINIKLEDGRLKGDPVLDGSVEPLITYPIKEANLTGALLCYEPPDPKAPAGTYVGGYDPYMMDESSYSPSVGAFYLYKRNIGDGSPAIVASYVGRPGKVEEAHRNVVKLLELYGGTVMYENMVSDFQTYVAQRHKLHLLEMQPDAVIKLNIKKTKVNRTFGSHMTPELRRAGEKYLSSWLLEVRNYDENGAEKLNLHTITDPGLLKELIYYKKDGNFDRIFAMFMIMFALTEDEIVEQTANRRTIMDDIVNYFDN